MLCLLDECLIEFIPKNSQQKYCSPKHMAKACNRKYRESLPQQNCQRQECGVRFQPNDKRQKYCSHRCSAIVVNGNKEPTVYYCLYCDAALPKGIKRYCNINHKIQFRIDEWLAGKVSGSDKNGNLKKLYRMYLLEKADFKCQSPNCYVPGGWSVPNPITKTPILTIDHINGDWTDNKYDNLLVLCYNCHTLTETFGSLNRGSKSGRRPNAQNRTKAI